MSRTINKYKKILITGTAGFIGFHLAKELLKNKNCKIIGVDIMTDYYDVRMKQKRNEILKRHPNYRFYKTNVADYKKFESIVKKEKPDIIIHLAAQAGVRYSLVNPWPYAESNYLATLNVLESAKRHGIKRVLVASSGSVYGKNEKMPFSEKHATDHPISIYGASKKASELLAHSYHHLYGIEVGLMRFFTAYGEYGRPDLALFKFVKSIITDKPIYVYNNGKMTRTFTHISDIISGIINLANKKELSCDIYNFSGNNPIKLLDFIKLIENSLDKKATINFLPMQPGDVKEALVDISKARKELNYNPKVSIEEGIDKFTRWFLNNKNWLLPLKDSD